MEAFGPGSPFMTSASSTMMMGGGGGQEGLELAGRRVEEMLHRDSEFPPLATKLKIAGTTLIYLLLISLPTVLQLYQDNKNTLLV